MKMTCNIALDLFPLIKDGVASEDSKELVLEHIKTCSHCRALWQETAPDEPMAKESHRFQNEKFLKRLRRSFYVLRFLVLIALSMLFSTFLSSSLIYVEFAAMPALGALAGMLLGSRKGLWIFPIITATAFLPLLLFYGKTSASDLPYALLFIPFLLILALLGYSCYFLLHYAITNKR